MLVGYLGLMRSGKTLSMTVRAYYLWRAGWDVYSNYPTRFSTYLARPDDLFAVRSGIVLIDELPMLADSRAFASNEMLIHWLPLIGKLQLHVFYSAQVLHMVDLRFRDLTDYFVSCTGTKKPVPAVRQRTFQNHTGKMMRASRLIHNSFFYGLYDTYQISGLDLGSNKSKTLSSVSRLTAAPPGGAEAVYSGSSARSRRLA